MCIFRWQHVSWHARRVEIGSRRLHQSWSLVPPDTGKLCSRTYYKVWQCVQSRWYHVILEHFLQCTRLASNTFRYLHCRPLAASPLLWVSLGRNVCYHLASARTTAPPISHLRELTSVEQKLITSGHQTCEHKAEFFDSREK